MNCRGCLGLVLLLSGAFAAVSPALAQEPDGSAGSVAQLEAILQQTTTFSAEVQQLLVDQDGRELQETKARLVMEKPSRFYWEVSEPYAELMVTDGELIWRYEPDLEQVSIQHFNDDLDRTPIMLLNGGSEAIAAAYEVSAAPMEDSHLSRFILLPRKPDSLFERMALTFRDNALIEMQFEDSLGQRTSLSFSQIERNREIAPELFVFTPPDGVEIIDTTLE